MVAVAGEPRASHDDNHSERYGCGQFLEGYPSLPNMFGSPNLARDSSAGHIYQFRRCSEAGR